MEYEKPYQIFLDENPYPRYLKSLEPIQGSSSIYLNYDGKRIINFSSSDYLGLATHPSLIERSQEYAELFGVGSSASRLVTGNFSIYTDLETKLARMLGTPAALILGTGYQTNISVIEALLDQKVLGAEPLVFCDRLCHVSMLTAARYKLHLQRFRHNDLNHLQELLEKSKHSIQPKFILAESIYSMEGDASDLPGLIKLANQYHAFLYIDDAHAVGIYGVNGWGKTTEYSSQIPMIMGTFSKGLGSFGAYIGCSETMRNYLINKCKGLIYSTGLSPAVLGAISAAIEILPTLSERRAYVLKQAARLRDFLKNNHLNFGQSTTHIVPWIIGDAKLTMLASNLLEEYGVLGTGIQPPSVPIGKSRIRFCITANHTEQDIEYLLEAIGKVARRL